MFMMPRLDRTLLSAAAVVLALGMASTRVDAQWKPTRAVEIIVPAGAGGGPDVTARLIQQIGAEKRIFETPAVVSNKSGGNHTIAWNYLDANNRSPAYLNHAESRRSWQLLNDEIRMLWRELAAAPS